MQTVLVFWYAVWSGTQPNPEKLGKVDTDDIPLECVSKSVSLGDVVSGGGGAEAGCVQEMAGRNPMN